MTTEEVLVSGGSGGIGAATCRALAARGLRPIVGYGAHRESAETIAAACGGRSLALDLGDDVSIANAIAALTSSSLAGVILAASPSLEILPFGQISAAATQKQWRINVEGPRLLLSGIVKSCLRKRKKGAVLGVLTQAMGSEERAAATSMGAYVIAKYGLQGLLKVLAAEYPWLTVKTVAPGYTDTAMLEAFDPRFLEQLRKAHALTSPDDVAQQIVEMILPS